MEKEIIDRAERYLEKLVCEESVYGADLHFFHDILLFLEESFSSMGFCCERWGEEKSIFFAHRKGSGPSLLVYGHYDVQPAGEGWESDPFILTRKGERLYARGANDNKGHLAVLLTALSYGIAENLDLKILIDSEEESGSPCLHKEALLRKARLKADHLLIFDTGMASLHRGCVTCGTRGIYPFEIELSVALCDKHSGLYGGVARSAALELIHLLSGMIGPNGQIQIKEVLEGVQPVEESLLNKLTYIPVRDCLAFSRDDATEMERNWFLPTLEIHGVKSGYLSQGMKTIIPATALAKLSLRSVKGQNGPRCLDAIESYLQSNKNEGVLLRFIRHEGGEAAFSSADSSFVRLCQQVWTSVTQEQATLAYSGASIPIAALLQRVSGADLAFTGIGLDEDQIHGANESISDQQLVYGVLFFQRLIESLADSSKGSFLGEASSCGQG